MASVGQTASVHAILAGPPLPMVPHVRNALLAFSLPPLAIVKVCFPVPSFFFCYQAYTGNIVCQLGCTQCVAGTGACTSCQSGFTQDPNDPTLCNPVQQSTNTGTACPDGSFANGGSCSICSPSCKTCNGATSNNCILCANGSFMSNGSCLTTDGNGVCEGSSLIADNNKHECDSE